MLEGWVWAGVVSVTKNLVSPKGNTLLYQSFLAMGGKTPLGIQTNKPQSTSPTFALLRKFLHVSPWPWNPIIVLIASFDKPWTISSPKFRP